MKVVLLLATIVITIIANILPKTIEAIVRHKAETQTALTSALGN